MAYEHLITYCGKAEDAYENIIENKELCSLFWFDFGFPPWIIIPVQPSPQKGWKSTTDSTYANHNSY